MRVLLLIVTSALAAALLLVLTVPAESVSHWAPGVAPTKVVPDYMEGDLEFTPLPVPQELEFGPSCLRVGKVAVVAPADYPHPYTVKSLAEALGTTSGTVSGSDTVAFLGLHALSILHAVGLKVPAKAGPEAYALFVGKNPNGDGQVIALAGRSMAAEYWALQTLSQLLARKDGVLYARQARIRDWPMMDWRGSKRPMAFESAYKANASWGAVGKRVGDKTFRTMHQLAVQDPQRAVDGRLDASEAFIRRTLVGTLDAKGRPRGGFKKDSDAGVRNFLVKFDDIRPRMTAETREKFGGSYGAAIRHYLMGLSKALSKWHPDNTLYWLPNPYYNTEFHFQKMGREIRKAGGLPPTIGLNWTGWAVFDMQMTERGLAAYGANFYGDGVTPSVKGIIYDNFGRIQETYADRYSDYHPMTGREPGIHKIVRGLCNERGSYVNRLTAYDQQWNPTAYDPGRSLKLACRELSAKDPGLYRAYLELCTLLWHDRYPPISAVTQKACAEHIASTDHELDGILARINSIADTALAPNLAADRLAREQHLKRKGRRPKYTPSDFRLKFLDLIRSDLGLRKWQSPHLREAGFRTVTARRARAPKLDGVLTDRTWAGVPAVSGFRRYVGGKKKTPDLVSPEFDTNLRVTYDDRNLYVAAVCRSTTPPSAKELTNAREHPESIDGDRVYAWRNRCIELLFEPRHRHRDHHHIIIDFLGQVCDEYVGWPGDDTGLALGPPWNSGTRVVTKLDPAGGWTMECAIPLASLGITSPPRPGDVWGFQVGRNIRGEGYTCLSAFWTGPYGIRKPDVFGHLEFK